MLVFRVIGPCPSPRLYNYFMNPHYDDRLGPPMPLMGTTITIFASREVSWWCNISTKGSNLKFLITSKLALGWSQRQAFLHGLLVLMSSRPIIDAIAIGSSGRSSGMQDLHVNFGYFKKISTVPSTKFILRRSDARLHTNYNQCRTLWRPPLTVTWERFVFECKCCLDFTEGFWTGFLSLHHCKMRNLLYHHYVSSQHHL